MKTTIESLHKSNAPHFRYKKYEYILSKDGNSQNGAYALQIAGPRVGAMVYFYNKMDVTVIESGDDAARLLLSSARAAQSKFWRALSRLEKTIGVDIDSTLDLEQYTVEMLCEARVSKSKAATL